MVNRGFERVKVQHGVPALQFLIEPLQSLECRAAWSIPLWAVRLNVNVRTHFQRGRLTTAIEPLYVNTIVGASGTFDDAQNSSMNFEE